MEKKFYIILFLISLVSIMLLGFSYSKESGISEKKFINEIETDDYRLISSNDGVIRTKYDDGVHINLINKKDISTTYVLLFEEINGKSYNDIYYTLNNGNAIKFDGLIVLDELNSFGIEGDQKNYYLTIDSFEEYDLKMSLKEINYSNCNDFLGTGDCSNNFEVTYGS